MIAYHSNFIEVVYLDLTKQNNISHAITWN